MSTANRQKKLSGVKSGRKNSFSFSTSVRKKYSPQLFSPKLKYLVRVPVFHHIFRDVPIDKKTSANDFIDVGKFKNIRRHTVDDKLQRRIYHTYIADNYDDVSRFIDTMGKKIYAEKNPGDPSFSVQVVKGRVTNSAGGVYLKKGQSTKKVSTTNLGRFGKNFSLIDNDIKGMLSAAQALIFDQQFSDVWQGKGETPEMETPTPDVATEIKYKKRRVRVTYTIPAMHVRYFRHAYDVRYTRDDKTKISYHVKGRWIDYQTKKQTITYLRKVRQK